jgi:hypothetical protein
MGELNYKSLPIIGISKRKEERKGITGCIFGKSGIGKTSLLWTLPVESTLFFDLEAGDLAVEGWKGDVIRPRMWQECRNIATFIGGANPALSENQAYSQSHYAAVCKHYGNTSVIDKYDTIFIDSITVAARLCFQWCKSQPQSFSERSGKLDIRATYALHGQEMIAWLTQFQHTRNKNIWFIGILDEKLDDLGRRIYVPQLEGSKTALELPGIVDEVITMAEIKSDSGKGSRAFICHTINEYGYPAKDRSGHLEEVEEPHLGKLMTKIKSKTAINPSLVKPTNNNK